MVAFEVFHAVKHDEFWQWPFSAITPKTSIGAFSCFIRETQANMFWLVSCVTPLELTGPIV